MKLVCKNHPAKVLSRITWGLLQNQFHKQRQNPQRKTMVQLVPHHEIIQNSHNQLMHKNPIRLCLLQVKQEIILISHSQRMQKKHIHHCLHQVNPEHQGIPIIMDMIPLMVRHHLNMVQVLVSIQTHIQEQTKPTNHLQPNHLQLTHLQHSLLFQCHH